MAKAKTTLAGNVQAVFLRDYPLDGALVKANTVQTLTAETAALLIAHGIVDTNQAAIAQAQQDNQAGN